MIRPVPMLLEPLDTLFFRDGRPLGAGVRAEGGLPTPQVLAGALRTALLEREGIDFGRVSRATGRGAAPLDALREAGAPEWIMKMRIRGPWLHCEEHGGPVLPLPASLRPVAGGGVTRLDPLSPEQRLPGWQPMAEGMRPLWPRDPRDPEKRRGLFLTVEGLARFLSGGVPRERDLVNPARLFAFSERTGIAVDGNTGSVREGLIYSARHLVLCRGVSFYAEVEAELPGDADPLDGLATLRFGGEGRCVALRSARHIRWPEASDTSGRMLLLLVQPGAFAEGWRPDQQPGGSRLVGAAVGDPVSVSGWDLARRGPKPTRYLAPPGSTYFFENARQSPPASLCGQPEDAQVGYGLALKGIWNHA